MIAANDILKLVCLYGLTSKSTIFQSCGDGDNLTTKGFKPPTSRSVDPCTNHYASVASQKSYLLWDMMMKQQALSENYKLQI